MSYRSLTIVLQGNPIRIEILRMMYIDGMNQKQIAGELGMTQQMVSNHLVTALEILRITPNLVIDFCDD